MAEEAETTHVNGASSECDKISQLPQPIYEAALKQIIENNFEDDDYEVEYSAGSNKGDNYVGVVYRIQVKSKTNPAKKLNVIAKLPPQDPARREQFLAAPAFSRESLFYDEILPLYNKFQREKGIDIQKEGFHHAPICFKSMTEEPYEALFFDDLKVRNFEMYDRFKELTPQHVMLMMKAIAKFHAISFALKDQKPEIIEKYKGMSEIFLDRRFDQNMILWFESIQQQARDSIQDCDEDVKERLNNFFKKTFIEIMEDCVTGEYAEPHAIICHGDVSFKFYLWKNVTCKYVQGQST